MCSDWQSSKCWLDRLKYNSHCPVCSDWQSSKCWLDLSTTHIVQYVLIDLSTTHIVQCVLTDRVVSVDWIDLSTTHIVQCVLTDRVVLYTEVPLRLRVVSVDWIDLSTTHSSLEKSMARVQLTLSSVPRLDLVLSTKCWLDRVSTTHIVQCVLTDRVVSVDWIDLLVGLRFPHIVQCSDWE